MKNPWGQREQQPALRIVVAALAVLIVGFLAYRQINRLLGETVTIWVAASDLAEGTVIAKKHLAPIKARTRDLSKDVIANPETIGRVELVRAKAAGRPFFDNDFRRVNPGPGPGLLASVPEGRVLMTYILPDLPISSLGSMLRLGDRFDIMAGRRRDEPLHLAHDVVFLGYIAPPPAESDDSESSGGVGGTLASSFLEAAEENVRAPASSEPASIPLILGVRPEDVRRLVWARSGGFRMFVIFHGREETESGELLSFPADPRPRADEMEVILGSKRRRVALEDPR